MKRLLLVLIVVGVVAYLWKTQITPHTTAPDAERGAPIERARAAARASDARTAAGEAAAKEADQGGAITENMTPDQIRRLLGSPDDISTETTASGATREVWTYKSVGKSVVFENGIVVSIQ